MSDEGGSFVGGSIKGFLGLDVGGFSEGMFTAEAAAELMPEWVKGFMVNPLVGFIEVAKEAAESFGEIFNEVANSELEIGDAANKLGVPVEWLSKLEVVGDHVGVKLDGIANGLKFLNRASAEAANEGNKSLLKAFDDLGVSQQFLQQHLGDTAAVFEAVRNGLEKIPDAASRTRIEMELLGRGGDEIGRLLGVSAEKAKEYIEFAESVGDISEDSGVQAAQAWRDVKAEWNEMIAGFEKELIIPLFKWIEAHHEEITADLKNVANVVETEVIPAIQSGFAILQADGPTAIQWINEATDHVQKFWDKLVAIEKWLTSNSIGQGVHNWIMTGDPSTAPPSAAPQSIQGAYRSWLLSGDSQTPLSHFDQAPPPDSHLGLFGGLRPIPRSIDSGSAPAPQSSPTTQPTSLNIRVNLDGHLIDRRNVQASIAGGFA